jgi:hypothetical protein
VTTDYRLLMKMLLLVVMPARLRNQIVKMREKKKVFYGICIVCLKEAASYGF